MKYSSVLKLQSTNVEESALPWSLKQQVEKLLRLVLEVHFPGNVIRHIESMFTDTRATRNCYILYMNDILNFCQATFTTSMQKDNGKPSKVRLPPYGLECVHFSMLFGSPWLHTAVENVLSVYDQNANGFCSADVCHSAESFDEVYGFRKVAKFRIAVLVSRSGKWPVEGNRSANRWIYSEVTVWPLPATWSSRIFVKTCFPPMLESSG